MREACKVHTIFLALQLFRMFALFAVVDLESIVVACYDRELARVVKIKRGNRSLRIRRFEFLCTRQVGTPIN